MLSLMGLIIGLITGLIVVDCITRWRAARVMTEARAAVNINRLIANKLARFYPLGIDSAILRRSGNGNRSLSPVNLNAVFPSAQTKTRCGTGMSSSYPGL